MKVYLDMCSIQRPLDSQDDVRVATEAQAVLGVLRLCESGQLTLVASDALRFELEKNPHPVEASGMQPLDGIALGVRRGGGCGFLLHLR